MPKRGKKSNNNVALKISRIILLIFSATLSMWYQCDTSRSNDYPVRHLDILRDPYTQGKWECDYYYQTLEYWPNGPSYVGEDER